MKTRIDKKNETCESSNLQIPQMIAWELPESLCVGGQEWKIRTDFRAILDIIRYFADPEYEADESWLICLTIPIYRF